MPESVKSHQSLIKVALHEQNCHTFLLSKRKKTKRIKNLCLKTQNSRQNASTITCIDVSLANAEPVRGSFVILIKQQPIILLRTSFQKNCQQHPGMFRMLFVGRQSFNLFDVIKKRGEGQHGGAAMAPNPRELKRYGGNLYKMLPSSG